MSARATINAGAALLFARELRGGKSLFLFAAATMMVATAALTLVLSLSHSFDASQQAQAQTLLGGDLDLRLSQREFSPQEQQWLAQNSAAQSHVRITRVLAVSQERAQLARLKGVDRAYPMFGELQLAAPHSNTDALFADPAAPPPHPAFIGQDLAQLLSLQKNDTFTAAGITLQVAGFILQEPDPDPRLWAGAPLILVNISVLQSDFFMRPGALVQRHTRIVLPPEQDVDTWQKNLTEAHPDAGWRIRAPENAQGAIGRLVSRMRDFLALASLAAMLLAGIGCGNALSAFLRARLRAIAVAKMVGAPAALIRRAYFYLAALFAAGGAAAGVAAGYALLFALAPLLSNFLPAPLQAHWSTETALRALLVSLAMCAAFAVPPILRFARINPLTLFAADSNEDAAPPPAAQERAISAAAAAAVAIALPLAWDKKALLAGIVVTAAVLYALTLLAARAAQRYAYALPTAWRLGLLAIARNKRQTAAAVMSFGVGVCALVAIINTQTNFSNRIDDSLRQRAPALFLMGIVPDNLPALQTIVDDSAPAARLRAIPTIRGRITALGGTPAKDIIAPPGEEWILRGDRNLTWSDGSYIGGSYVTEGKLWDEGIPGLQASFDDEAARAFGLQIGDTMELNILGEPVTAVISSFREIDWQTFDMNFAIILSDVPVPDLPYNLMGGVYLPPNTPAVQTQKRIYDALPHIVPINTEMVLAAAKNLLLRVAALLQATALFLALAGLPMILATLIENRRRRLAAAVTLRLLGATRATIIKSGIAEFLIMALLAAIPAALLGALAGRVIITTIFDLHWQSQWHIAAALAAGAAAVFLLLGASDIARAARQAPYAMLRNQ